MDKQNVRTLSLIVCCFTYLLVGAAIFDALESENEIKMRNALSEREMKIQTKYNISRQDMEDIRRNMIRMVPYKAGTQWKFAGAFYFSLTVVAVIGYGHSTPQTVGGKIFCMFYAISGIPLCIVMFQSVGERLNILLTYMLQKIKKCFKSKNSEVSQSSLLFITFNISSLILTVGAAIFSHYEGWQYIDAFYYCFITLTTIGFGDYVALQRDNMLSRHPDYVAFSIIFILFGLTVLSAAMNLLVLRFLTINVVEEECTETEGTAIRVGDDVITTNGMVVSAAQEAPDHSERISVCSCTCYTLRSGRFRRRIESSDARKARKASMLMSGAQTDADERTCKPYETEERISLAEENNITQWRDVCDRKRASI